ncbi:GDSL esterase/lipase-like protein [Tanacetum coccineum]|uniref:GDSL esterase/lipase-like protein n=1 Tax=Tanacetum coccineum TaxID=301880 RepID=A0ABQ5B8G3_9ASTR
MGDVGKCVLLVNGDVCTEQRILVQLHGFKVPCCAPQVPCYFIFGDSLYDNGNNNNLVTEAKANYPPYGIDFPDGPTGRFSNGRNIADSLPPLWQLPSPEESVLGVNYASGSAGIRDETGQHMILYNRMWQERFGIRLEPSYSGCAPEMMTRYNTNVCVDAINGAVVQFNAKLVAALGELESKLTGAKFIYMNPSLANSTEKG